MEEIVPIIFVGCTACTQVTSFSIGLPPACSRTNCKQGHRDTTRSYDAKRDLVPDEDWLGVG